MSREAIIVIDMQEGFRYPESEVIIPNIIKRLENFSGFKIFTQFFDRKGSLFELQLKWPKFQDQDNQKIMNEFDKIEKKVFRHSSYTAITQELINFSRKEKIEKVFLLGIYTDVSVLKSAMDLFDSGFEVFVVKDCCNSIHQNQKNNLHESGLESISHIIGSDHII